MTTASIRIDNEKFDVPRGVTAGADLIQLAGLSGSQQLVLKYPGEPDVPLGPADVIIISGNETFFRNTGAPVPDNPDFLHPEKVQINKKQLPILRPKVTAAELKTLARGTADGQLTVDVDGSDDPIRDDARVLVQKDDRFTVSPPGNVGRNPVDDQFAAVKARYTLAHIAADGGNSMLVVPGLALPKGWSHPAVDFMVVVPNGFPVAALDMFYVRPTLTLADGRRPGGGDHHEQHGGLQWQRFSWHYTKPWDPATDTLLTHIAFCVSRLGRLE